MWFFALLAQFCFLFSPFRLNAQPAPELKQARPWLGVAIDKGDQGVLVNEILPDTPAAISGLQKGDQITAVDQAKVTSPEELIKTVQVRGVGNTVVIHWRRGEKVMQHEVKLVARPDELALLKSRFVGKPAPEFDLPVISGNAPGKTSALLGKVTVLEFWATWCPACLSTHPRLSEFAAKNKDSIAVLAISDEDDATLKEYAKAQKANFTMLRDTDHKTSSSYGTSAIPEIIVIDKKGAVTHATIGAGTYLEEALAIAEAAAK